MVPERRLALIHRVIVPDKEYPKEYAILVTDRRSIFIRQSRTSGNFWLRREMSYGTALITNVVPKTLEDYEQTSLESLTADSANLRVPHEEVISLAMQKEEQKPHAYDFFVRLTMRMQGEEFRVYYFEMNYRQIQNPETKIMFYMVPLGAYFKPRRQTLTRETILREYATDAFEIFQKVLPAKIMSS
ncbi:MAG: hypothetical protein AUF79_05015 [Crenarchaeota archaeon 13_1_20CM_2_51_8]|nr:MAG: hypothetical protein AUF79_05015 [Crenarchaeota archaeon 13_1_20CM_2_51_8]